MKKYSILLIILAISVWSTFAQEDKRDTVSSFRNDLKDNSVQTIFGSKPAHGGYFAFSVQYASLDQRDGMKIGGRGGWIVDHKFAIGLCGYGFFNEHQKFIDLRDDPAYKYGLGGGYGGLFIEPILFPKSPVHISFPIILGGGGVAYTSSYENYSWDKTNKWDGSLEDSRAFFIVEPGIELEFNLVKYFRLSLGAYYRHTSNIAMETVSYDTGKPVTLTSKDALNGLSFGLNLKFGIF
jgi:hypothetical protein